MKECWCGNTEFISYSEHYWKCEKCNTLITKQEICYDPDRIDDDHDFYGKQYWEEKMEDAAKAHSLDEVVDLYLHERAVYWLKNMFRWLVPGGGHIAEAGCGLGQFSYLLKECGYRQTAFELSPQICNYIRRTLGLNVVCGGMQLSAEEYDGICAFDVLEHITDPNAFLETAAKSLKPQGIFMIQMPCYDEKLTYSEMLCKKPRFQQLMEEDEHIYLYSRSAAQRILKEHGFEYVQFIDAFFGNDYDMFLVASKEPLQEKTAAEIDQALNGLEHGRLIKALINCWDEKRSTEDLLDICEADRKKRAEQIKKLTKELDERAQQRKTQEAELLSQIKRLTDMIDEKQRQLETVEADREERKEQIKKLTGMLDEREQQRQTQETELLSQIKLLTDMINEKQRQLEISEADREERLKQILTLTDMLKNNQA